jgi:DNA helicase-4
VKFEAGYADFAPGTDVLDRVVFAPGTLVRIVSDNVVGTTRDRTQTDGSLIYEVVLPDGVIRRVPEADLRSEHEIKVLEEQRSAEERRAQQREKARKDAAERDREEARLREEARREQLLRLEAAIAADFLGADEVFAALTPKIVTAAEFEKLKSSFVQAWAERELHESLDEEQAAAVATIGGDVKVVARAGSGKTRTLTTRVIFLQKHCGVAPSEMLLLAYNKKAAGEMRERLTAKLGSDLPHVMTFHALAHALVHPDEELLYDDVSADQLGLSREVQDVIDEHIRSPEHHDRIRDLMLAHFREDWERIVESGAALSISEFVAYRRALPRESLRGDYVKSLGEREIANTLFEHDIPYSYERNQRWNGINYRPDFMIFRAGGGIVIEYFGLEGDPDYDQKSERKRAYWGSRDGWTLLEYSPRDLAVEGLDAFRRRLVDDLTRLGISIRRKAEEEIWEEVRPRAIDRFTGTMRNFVGRARKRNLAAEALAELVAGHAPASRSEELFLKTGVSVYRRYIARLMELGKEDFDGLMWRASKQVRKRSTRFVRDQGREQGDVAGLRHVLVDEFQDFSEMFAAMLDAIRAVGPAAQFFCVGDDWQAIYAFAGADLRFFGDFNDRFRDPKERAITTNYRSTDDVVTIGNAVMHGLGAPARPRPNPRPGRVEVWALDQFIPTLSERALHEDDEITPAILRLVRRFLDHGQDVVLLGRRNQMRGYVKYRGATSRPDHSLDRFISHVRSFLPKDDRRRVAISTVHRFKGLEKPAVIVLDAMQGSYPLIHPAWGFLRVFGDTLELLEAEERRLFYVAVTRARESLALITERDRMSPFLAAAQKLARLPTGEWDTLPAVAASDDPRVEVRVHDGYTVREQIRVLGFHYEGRGRYWHRDYQAAGFRLEVLSEQEWAKNCGEVTVHSESGELLHSWRPTSENKDETGGW